MECPYCGQDWYSEKSRLSVSCPGPTIEEMHRNLAENLKRVQFIPLEESGK